MFEAKTGARVLGFKTKGTGAARVEAGFIKGIDEITFKVGRSPLLAMHGVCERLANKALGTEVEGDSWPLVPIQRHG